VVVDTGSKWGSPREGRHLIFFEYFFFGLTGVKVVVDTGSKWDGVEKIASLEACNGVTKSRGAVH
jgi:hypothetical protein